MPPRRVTPAKAYLLPQLYPQAGAEDEPIEETPTPTPRPPVWRPEPYVPPAPSGNIPGSNIPRNWAAIMGAGPAGGIYPIPFDLPSNLSIRVPPTKAINPIVPPPVPPPNVPGLGPKPDLGNLPEGWDYEPRAFKDNFGKITFAWLPVEVKPKVDFGQYKTLTPEQVATAQRLYDTDSKLTATQAIDQALQMNPAKKANIITISEDEADGSRWERRYSLNPDGSRGAMLDEKQIRPPKVALRYFDEPGTDEGSVIRRGYQVNPDGTLGDMVSEKTIKGAKPLIPLPAGQDRSFVDANGYTWTWDEKKGDYNQTGYTSTKPPQKPLSGTVPNPFGVDLPQVPVDWVYDPNAKQWVLDVLGSRKQALEEAQATDVRAQRSWAAGIEAERLRRETAKEAATEAEKEYQRQMTLPFSAIMAGIQQRTGQPIGDPKNYEDMVKSLLLDQVPKAVPQPQGSSFPMWNLPGGQVETVNKLRMAGMLIPGTEPAYFDMPWGRVSATAPEFKALLAKGQKSYLPPLSETTSAQFSPVQPGYNPNASPFEVRDWWETLKAGGAAGQGVAEQNRIGLEQQRRQELMPQLTAQYRARRKPFWQG